MWRVIYLVSPRTPEGGQAGKGDKPLPLQILRSRGLPFKGGIRDGKDEGNVGKIFFYTHSRLLIVTYSANVILRGF